MGVELITLRPRVSCSTDELARCPITCKSKISPEAALPRPAVSASVASGAQGRGHPHSTRNAGLEFL